MNEDSTRLVMAIEAWFCSHEDGDFGALPLEHKSLVEGDHHAAKSVVYRTKLQSHTRIHEVDSFPQPAFIICRPGLPVHEDLPLFQGGANCVERFFFGDADPMDLMVFAWLRAHLPITWAGVNDEFLRRRNNLNRKNLQIALSDSEREAMSVMHLYCPDFKELLGPHCAALLATGFKIEFEGATI